MRVGRRVARAPEPRLTSACVIADAAPPMRLRLALAIAALSGFIALSYEIVWYRVLAVMTPLFVSTIWAKRCVPSHSFLRTSRSQSRS